jgi:hypothetical protein
LTDIVANAAKKLLNFDYVYGSENLQASQMILLCAKLVPWAASQDNFALCQTLMPLFTPNQLYYRNNDISFR